MENGKLILDACCGSRMFWFDKHNPLALFVDKRSEIVTAKDRAILKRQVGKIGYYIRFYFYSSDFISVLGSYYFRSLINE